MIKKILCLTDFSESSGYATAAALSIAQRTAAEVIFVHGMTVGLRWDKLDEATRKKYPEIAHQVNDAKRKLSILVDRCKNDGVACNYEIRFADGQKNMASQLLLGDYDLLIMGAKGFGEHSQFSIGANAVKILRTAKKPVLILKELPRQPISFETVVFATGMEADTHSAFEKLLEFSKYFGSRTMYLLAVTTPHNFQPTSKVMETMRKFVSDHQMANLYLHNTNHYSVEAGILEFAEEKKADLLAIANHGRNDITGLFIESIPENLVKYGHLPVLSIRV